MRAARATRNSTDVGLAAENAKPFSFCYYNSGTDSRVGNIIIPLPLRPYGSGSKLNGS